MGTQSINDMLNDVVASTKDSDFNFSASYNAEWNASGPLRKLSLNKFETSLPLSFPLDVGGEEYPHYLQFNIFTPPKSKYTSAGGGGTKLVDLSSQIGNISNTTQNLGAILYATFKGAEGAGKIESGNIVGGARDLIGAGMGAAVIESVGKIQRDYKLLKQVIRLYVPETAQQTLSNKYNATSLTEALGMYGLVAQAADSVGKNIVDAIKAGNLGALKGIPGASIAEAVGTFGGGGIVGSNIKDLVTQRAGFAINPQLEILYESPSHREYQFTFKMTPRNQTEAIEMLQIAKAFKFYSSPELSEDGGGRYYIPPGIFGIYYMYNNNQNNAMHKFLPSVLTSINVNYVTTGQFATYADGIPVEIEMVLQFQEIDVITKEKVIQGY